MNPEFGEHFKAHGHDDYEADAKAMQEAESPIVFGKRWEIDEEDG